MARGLGASALSGDYMKQKALIAVAVVAVTAAGITMVRRHGATPVKTRAVEANAVKTFEPVLTDEAAAKAICGIFEFLDQVHYPIFAICCVRGA